MNSEFTECYSVSVLVKKMLEDNVDGVLKALNEWHIVIL